MLSKEELYANINTEYAISKDYLKESRYGLCHYINDLCIAIKVPTEVASMAMCMTNYFFVKKCYFNYEKLTLACAAILLSSKEQNSQNKFNEIAKEYLKFNSKIFGLVNPVFNTNDTQKIKDKISTYEIILLKTLHFDFKLPLPFDYIYAYSSILYPHNEDDIIWTSRCVSHDAYYTFAPNVYPNYTVALASIIIAAKFLMIPTLLDEDFKEVELMKGYHDGIVNGKSKDEFDKALMSWESKPPVLKVKDECGMICEEDEYFDGLSIAQKLHPKMTMEELVDCVEMIVEFYQDAKRLVSNKAGEKKLNEQQQKEAMQSQSQPKKESDIMFAV